MEHESVLLNECAEFLAPGPGRVLIDGTIGLGGHAERLLELSGPDGRLLGFDKDPEALAKAGERLSKYGERLVLIHDDFKNIAGYLKESGVKNAAGILLDLGVSSPQLDQPRRGFSFRFDGPLDMRMDATRAEGPTARELVNRLPEKELADLLRKLGEERFARRIAARIVRDRAVRPIDSTLDLEKIIFSAVPKSCRHGRIHPATRSFQALRIAVNDELGSLEEFLSGAFMEYLAPGARVAVISFHSLEDRLVKNAFREFARNALGTVLTRKPLGASEAETAGNLRARSARLRVFEKTAEGTA